MPVYTESEEAGSVSIENPSTHAGRIEALRQLVPEAFIEGELNGAALQEALGLAEAPAQTERYGLHWPGKAEAASALRIGTKATLIPDMDVSIDFDTASNLMIEGDNLEAMRVLQRSLHGRVKLIYIDPPYNFNADFVYNDNYSSGLDEYLEYTRQVGKDGFRSSSNLETNGRYHSVWLSMMYPRLAMARTLLRPDGVIFVSIDDHEAATLKLMMDEVFGPENFVAQVIWQRSLGLRNDAAQFSVGHEYLLVYARNTEAWQPRLLPRTDAANARYKNLDNDSRGLWKPTDISAKSGSDAMRYPVVGPRGQTIPGPPAGSYWRFASATFQKLNADNRIYWGKEGGGHPALKSFLSEVQQGIVPSTNWDHQTAGHTRQAKEELNRRISIPAGGDAFQTPKPTRLIRHILDIATVPDQSDIIVDFFAGTGTTGDAVMQQNAEDGGNRRFILVQLPEPCPTTGFKTIADITRARLRAAHDDAILKAGLLVGDKTRFGYRDVHLGTSCWQEWQDLPVEEMPQLPGLIEQFGVTVAGQAEPEAIIMEVLLREGMDPIAPWQRISIDGTPIVVVIDGPRHMAICLQNDESAIMVKRLIATNPDLTEVVMLEDPFSRHDADKANTYQILRQASIVFKTV